MSGGTGNYRWTGSFWELAHHPGVDRFADLDVPNPQTHYPFDGQQRDVFALLLSAVEPGTPQHLAFLITFERYGEIHAERSKLKWPGEVT